jgi:hypothetical protein
MTKLKLLLLAAPLLAMSSCLKNDDSNNGTGTTTTTTGTTVAIKVVDGHSGVAVPGAAVSLYATSADVTANTPTYSLTTDQTGVAQSPVNFVSQYYVIAQKEGEKNYYSGLIPVGLFTSTAEIQSSAIQTPAATIGSVKFQDTNGDGVISALDDTTPPPLALMNDKANTFTVTVY